MGIQNQIQQYSLQIIGILGHTNQFLGDCNSWICQEDPEDTIERDSEGGKNQKKVFQHKMTGLWKK